MKRALIILASTLALCACGTTNTRDDGYADDSNSESINNRSQVHNGRGVIRDIDLVRRDAPDNSIGLGTVAGAVVGGILGNQVGGGTGKKVATVAGAVGGGYVGHQLEKKDASNLYRFEVRMDNGDYQRLLLDSNPGLRVGERVKIVDGVLRRE